MRANNTSELSDILVKAMQLSDIKVGDRVILLTTHVYNREYSRHVEAFRIALNTIGAEFVTMELPPVAEGMQPADPLRPFSAELLTQAEFVVRSAPDPWHPRTPEVDMYTELFSSVLQSGTRWLDFMLDEPSIWRLFPTPELIERTQKGAERLERAELIRITSDAGTDMTCSKKGRKAHRQCGVVHEKGSWDNFGFGMVSTAPVEQTANGVVVVSPGDSAAQVHPTTIDYETTTWRFENGKVVAIEGGTSAALLRRAVARFPDQDGAYRIAHIGWGTLDRGMWGGMNFTLAEWESYYGCVCLHFGTNTFDTPARYCGMGGKIQPGIFHWGGSLLNCSLYLDDELIVDHGKIVAEGLK